MTSAFSLDERVLGREEIARAAQVATRAFFNDHYFRFLLPDDQVRRRASARLFAGQIRYAGAHARVVTARDAKLNIVGVAIWIEPGHWPPPLGAQLAQTPSSLRALFRQPRALRVAGTYLRAIMKVHPREPHWYLPLLATDPSLQGRGVGTLLMNDGVARMQSDGVGGYLETQKVENHAFYHRFGYELSNTLHPKTDGPPYYTMWRPAP